MNILRKKSHLYSQIFLTLLLLMFGNTLFFQHIHELDNGKVIAHAHPYAAEDDQMPDHSHSDAEIVFLDFVTNAHFIEGCTPAISWSVDSICNVEIASNYNFAFHSTPDLSYHLRGPPSLV